MESKAFFASKKTITVYSGCVALVDLVYACEYMRFRFIVVLMPEQNPGSKESDKYGGETITHGFVKNTDVPNTVECFFCIKENHYCRFWVGGASGSGVSSSVHSFEVYAGAVSWSETCLYLWDQVNIRSSEKQSRWRVWRQ